MRTALSTVEANSVTARVKRLRNLAKSDPEAAQDAVWGWLHRLTTDVLATQAVAELAQLYAASEPADVDGKTEGLFVGFVKPVGLDRAGLYVWSGAKALIGWAPCMPWLGKKFDKAAHRGTNAVTGLAAGLFKVLAPRYKMHKVGDHFEGFEMKNWIEESVISPGTKVLVLDYEGIGTNPWPINRIRDEAVQVVPGVYLGAKLWHQADGYRQLAWWAAKAANR